MFDKEYSFRGRHAEMVRRLTAEFDSQHHQLFARNIDVYMVAPVIGFMYNRRADLDKGPESTKIFPEQLLNERNTLLFVYRLIVLLDKDHEPGLDERIDKAFRYYYTERAIPDEERFEQYVRGGVEVLHEKLLTDIRSQDDYLQNLCDFLEEFDQRYNQAIPIDSILSLCNLARA